MQQNGWAFSVVLAVVHCLLFIIGVGCFNVYLFMVCLNLHDVDARVLGLSKFVALAIDSSSAKGGLCRDCE